MRHDRVTTATNHYLYNGKELNEDLGLDWYDYGARFYDGELGRFPSVDPLADHPVQVDKSSYAYTWNNPVNLTDPDGRCPRCLKAIGKTVVKSIAKGKLDLGEVYDIVDSGVTLLSPSSTPLQRAEAGFNLLSPVSTKELKAAKNFVEGAGDAKKTINKASDVVDKVDDVKRIGPAGDAGAIVTKQVPPDWTVTSAKKGNGTRFIDPQNPKSNNVRVMQGNSNSPNPSQQVDYVKHTKNGTSVDKNGNPTQNNTPEAHIPKEEFKIDQ